MPTKMSVLISLSLHVIVTVTVWKIPGGLLREEPIFLPRLIEVGPPVSETELARQEEAIVHDIAVKPPTAPQETAKVKQGDVESRDSNVENPNPPSRPAPIPAPRLLPEPAAAPVSIEEPLQPILVPAQSVTRVDYAGTQSAAGQAAGSTPTAADLHVFGDVGEAALTTAPAVFLDHKPVTAAPRAKLQVSAERFNAAGKNVPSFVVQNLTPAQIDLMLEAQQGSLIVLCNKAQYILDGTLREPRSVRLINRRDLEPLADRALRVRTEDCGRVAECLRSMYAIPDEHLSQSSFRLVLINELDHVILNRQQAAAVRGEQRLDDIVETIGFLEFTANNPANGGVRDFRITTLRLENGQCVRLDSNPPSAPLPKDRQPGPASQ